MIWNLFYKEWIKTRWAFLGILVIGVGTILYIFTGVENRITMIGAKNYMLRVLYNTPQVIYYSHFKYIPFLMACCIGLSQFLPEVLQKRIRLTLHLPVSSNKLIGEMVLFGLIILSIGNLVFAGLFLWFNTGLFPAEITRPAMTSMVPWFLGSYATYHFIAMIAMEPNRWRQVIYSVMAWYIIGFFMVGINTHGDYGSSIPGLIVMAVLSALPVLYTSYRFNKGEK